MKKSLHGLRHGKVINSYYIVDTKSDPDWVLLNLPQGQPFARISKVSHGKGFRQGNNPDYTGRDMYKLEYFFQGKWQLYDNQASYGDITSQLDRLIRLAN
jgi:hypothetical protein